MRNGVRLAGDAQFDGEFLEEGTPLLDRWRGWLANGGEKLPRSFKAAGMVDMGPLFSPRDHTYLLVNGGASRLSFGGTAPFSLAVQFCAQPSGGSGGSGGGSGGGGGGSGGAARAAGVLLSKFQTGLRGEYRLGVDEQLRPFFHREVEPWELVAPRAVTAGEWHEVVATYDGTTMRLFVDRRVAASAKSGAQFTDQVTPVTIGAEFGRSTVENHFDGYIAEVRIWNRALSSDEAAAVFNSSSKGTSLHRGLQAPRAEAPPHSPGPHRSSPSPSQPAPTTPSPQAHWRPIDAKLDEPDGRVLVHNAVANRAHATTTLDAMLKRNVATYPLELTLRPGVRAVLVELGSMLRHSPQWRRGVEMVSRHNCYKHYCYLGTSVALQKSLLQVTGAILAQFWRNSAQFGAIILTARAACCRRSTSTPTSSSRSGCRGPTTTTTTP